MIKIGTRRSTLALWQANEVKNKLETFGHSCKLIHIESSGDQDLTQPLYAMGRPASLGAHHSTRIARPESLDPNQ